jgi:hypothetical protein
MPLKQIFSLGVGQLAVMDDDDTGLSVPRIVGWGVLRAPGGAPSWFSHSAYFTDVVNDNGLGDYTIHQVVADANVYCIAAEDGNGADVYQDGPTAAGAMNIKCKTWTGAGVTVDAGTHAGTITGDPVSADLPAQRFIIAIKLL